MMRPVIGADKDDLNYWSPWRRHYFLTLLCIVGIFNFIDRQIVSILLEPIKTEFHASDTEMGLLTGLLFAGFYLVGALPAARLAEYFPRKWVIALSLLAWSGCTTLGGFARSFWQLATTRIGVALTEGGALPISQSLITDLYPAASRARAFAILTSAHAIGVGISVFFGGWLSHNFGWRSSFFVVGAPGVLFGILIMLTIKEPPRGLSDRMARRREEEIVAPAAAVEAQTPPPFLAALRILWSLRSYRYLVLTTILAGVAALGFLSWGPTFLMRVHGMTQVQVGGWFGVTVASSLVLGALSGGFLGDRLGRNGVQGYRWMLSAGPLLSIIPGLLFCFSATWQVAVAALFFWSLLLTTYQPVGTKIAQSLVPLRMRATAAVVLTFGTGVFGSGLAPVLVGALNDLWEPTLGPEAIRYSLALVSVFAAAGAATSFLAMRWVEADYRSVHGVDYPVA
nr:MFS transporter [Sphingomonas sp. CDS-1]